MAMATMCRKRPKSRAVTESWSGDVDLVSRDSRNSRQSWATLLGRDSRFDYHVD